MTDTYNHDAALAALLSTPRVINRCESCGGPLNTQTGECRCSG